MTSKVKQLQDIIDNNAEKISNQEYLIVCNLMKDIYSIILRHEPIRHRLTDDQVWALQQISRLEGMKWNNISYEIKTEAMLVELDLLDEKSSYEDRPLCELEKLVLYHYGKVNTHPIRQNIFLKKIYNTYKKFQNENIQKKINNMRIRFRV